MKDRTIDAYNKIAEHFEKTHLKEMWLEELEYFKKIIKGNKILEIGCGTAREARFLIENGFDYTGIDASESMLDIAKDKLKKGNFLKMNFYNLKFDKESFDGFLAIASLLHVPKYKISKVLTSIRGIIRNNGIGFISLKEKNQLDEGFIKNKDLGIERYFSFYTMNEFNIILKKNNFDVIKKGYKKEYDGTDWLYFFVKKV